MPRRPRQESSTGIYHVTTRGVNRQVIFGDDQDRFYHLKLLRETSGECQVAVLTYCLMTNHTHLVLRDREKNLSAFMHQVNFRYATYFNKKYDRVGYLFQNRYHSESIENQAYFAAVMRYVIHNPEKANMAPYDKYQWSGYWELVAAAEGKPKVSPVSSPEETLRLMGENANPREFFKHWDEEEKRVQKFELSNSEYYRALARAVLGDVKVEDLVGMPEEERNESLKLLLRKGIPPRRLEKLTGISRYRIQQAV